MMLENTTTDINMKNPSIPSARQLQPQGIVMLAIGWAQKLARSLRA